MAFQAVIFDLDGTLLNTLDDLTDSVNYALQKFHKPLRSEEEVRQFVGNGIAKLMERAVRTGRTSRAGENFADVSGILWTALSG